MKRLALTILAAGILTSAAFAQKINFGLKAGLNIANQDYETSGISVSPDSRLGIHAGGFATIMFSDQLGLQPELLYNQTGSEWDIDGDNGTINVKMDYLSLPIMLRYQPIKLLNIHVGPQFGYILKAESDDEDIKDDLKALDIGAAVGAGVDLPVGIGLTARYTFGLSDVSDVSGIKIKNNVFQISLTYKFFRED